jgi:hypothetical protein
MKKNDSFSYDVRKTEQISIEVTPKRFRDSLFSVRAERDGNIFPRRPNTNNAPVYQFTVSKEVDDIHTVKMEFTFIKGSPDDAFYDVAISGEQDDGCPCGFVIKKTTGNKEPSIEFFVVANS